MSQRKILVTCALLYANGPLHLGHLLEHIQADIWVRFQRLRGHDCQFISGEDAHGTPIMLAALKQNITPESLIQQMFAAHYEDLQAFGISFDHFGSTHSPENENYANLVYQKLVDKGSITTRIVDQAYDQSLNMFLPDRYIKGNCPRCTAPNQYGDNCEVCGATYEALSLNQPISVLSKTTPIAKASEQYFFKLSEYSAFLAHWIDSEALSEKIRNKLREWFKTGLQDWSISREAPYFGFKIPGTVDKYFYVWLDAPIGYMAIFKQLCQKNSALCFDDYWLCQAKTELYHVIGKDIVNFHALFWPAMLKGCDFRLPTKLFVHGYLTIEGLKMSKSRGTFIKARDYLNHLNPEYLRYYLASKMSDNVEDIDLNAIDFMKKVNVDLVGKFVNIASRCAKLMSKYFNNKLSDELQNPALINHFVQLGETIAKNFENRQYNCALRHIMTLADKANQYLDEWKPWLLVKNPETLATAHIVCTMGLNLFRILLIYLKPVLPTLTMQAEQFLGISELSWLDLKTTLTSSTIQNYPTLLQRISTEQLENCFGGIKQDII